MEIPEIPSVFFIRGVFKHTAKNIQEILELDRKIRFDDDSDGEESTEAPLLKFYMDQSDDKWVQQRTVKCTSCPTMSPDRAIFIPESIERVKIPNEIASVLKWKC